ncbi:hypothetical protein [uncultured Bradyrhizobium sp.]|uniref:hypothetical protein n=1 Tax=uncultured Bradyrhizobium sp. TaxID=199684 RepID=UPI0035CBE7FC
MQVADDAESVNDLVGRRRQILTDRGMFPPREDNAERVEGRARSEPGGFEIVARQLDAQEITVQSDLRQLNATSTWLHFSAKQTKTWRKHFNARL